MVDLKEALLYLAWLTAVRLLAIYGAYRLARDLIPLFPAIWN